MPFYMSLLFLVLRISTLKYQLYYCGAISEAKFKPKLICVSEGFYYHSTSVLHLWCMQKWFWSHNYGGQSLSSVGLCGLYPVDSICQAHLFMGFCRQEYLSELPFPSPGDLPDSGIKPGSPVLQENSLMSEPPRKL